MLLKLIAINSIIATDLTEIKRIVREYHEQLYANKLDNIYEKDNS